MAMSGATSRRTYWTIRMPCIWLNIYLLLSYRCCTARALCTDKDTLLEFKNIVDRWGVKLTDWNADDDSPCGWKNVKCQDGSVNVSSLDLEAMHFEGTLPSILGSLQSLQSLVLSSNSFSGPIPGFLGSLPNLESLDLSDNSFSGPIPSNLANAKRLKTLRLEGNELSGSLIESLRSLDLQVLEDLNLSGNRFSGPIPEQISKAKCLKSLQLYSNDLAGAIPSSISELRRLEVLYLFNNSLSGRIPNLTGLQNLTNLDLGYNHLSGTLSGLENLTSLTQLQLRHNLFSEKAPAFERLKNVRFLDLSENKLTGEIPVGIANMSDLQSLDLSRNRLEGAIPPSIAKLSNLLDLDVSYNSLRGSMPSEIGSMSNLVSLALSFNNLSGEIPRGIVGMSNLKELNLASNCLDGEIPSTITEIASLTDLNLASNCLQGKIPTGTWNDQMQRVDLSDNRLNGSFPSQMLTKGMEYFNLSGNLLTGSIHMFGQGLNNSDLYTEFLSFKPEEMQLQTLDLSNNLLQGDISAMLLEKLPRLKELRLKKNGFWGDIPVGPRIWTGLQALDVSNNALNLSTGSESTLQVIVDSYTALGELRLSNNLATGTLPSSASKLYLLEVLDLSNSNLTGNLTEAFPIFTGTYLRALKYVNLSNNQLWGEIPPGFSEMLNLTYLDVSNNNLSGPVPNLPRLTVNVSFFFSGGNRELCGAAGLKQCPRPGKPVPWKLLTVVGASVLMSALSFLLLAWRWRAYSKKHQQDEDLIAQLLDRETATTLMSLQDLRRATNNFSESCQIGEGGFGLVYRGVLADGTTVAIKRSKREATAEHKLQFLNEVKILSQVHHRNLVKLLGCCLEKKIALLVFEYVPNGNLEEHLRWKRPGTLEEHLQCTRPDQYVPLTWRQRLRIAVQTADALTYLHSSANPPIYHLDVKSANVLLDENLNAKVTDFGVSKLAPALDATHITAPKIQGTVGYMDPDYFSSYQLTGKSDVFAFGVVLLELISAQAAVDRCRGEKEEVILSSLAIRLIHSGDFHRLVDPALYDTFESESGYHSIWEVGRLAIRCLKGDPRERPFMAEVLSELLALRQQPDSTFEYQSDSTSVDSQFESPARHHSVFPLLPCQPFVTHPATQPEKQSRLSGMADRSAFTL